MTGRRSVRAEKLHRPPLRLPRPADGLVGALRWFVAAGLVGLAGLLLAAGPARAAPGPSAVVLVAAHGLSGGVPLSVTDVRAVRLPLAGIPAGALRETAAAVGRAPAGPVGRGEVLTDLRLLGPALLRAAGGAGAVAAPVRIADPGAVALVRPGDRVDVVAAGGGAAETGHLVAADLPVVAVPGPGDGAAEGALVVLAASPAVAARLVGAAGAARLSLTVRSR